MRESKLFNYVSKQVGKAIADYDMLKEGDKILVAVSGGKDSLSLLNLLLYRQKFIPIQITLRAVYVDAGIPGFPLAELIRFFEENHIDYHVEKTDFLQGRSFEEIDCYQCAEARRSALFRLAEGFGFNKIAFGHHLDDIAETILMNMFFRAELGAMCPRQELFGGKITLIRPLAYVNEADIVALAQEGYVTRLDQFRCPNDETSMRRVLKNMLKELTALNPHVKKNIILSLQKIKTDYLP